MDTVILAAGRGTGLKGVMPPYFKPLLVVGGEPIVVGAAKRAWIAGSRHIIIVAAPENALPIAQLMEHAVPKDMDYSITIQVAMAGVGDALLTGLKLVRSDEVLVLLGDNVTTYGDIQRLMSKQGNAIGIQSMARTDNLFRYTRIRVDGKWVEKVPVTDADCHNAGEAVIWVGPIKVSVQEITESLKSWQESSFDGELRLGPCFNDLTNVKTVDVSSLDINVPEQIPS